MQKKLALLLLATSTLVAGCSLPEEATDYSGSGTGSATITIESGDSGRAIGQTLEEADVVASDEAFVRALKQEPSANLVPGTYELRTQMSAASALDLLLAPEARVDAKVTVVEGLTALQTFEALSEATGIPREEYDAAWPQLRLPTWAAGIPEGVLQPATYEMNELSALEQLQMLVDESVKRWSATGLSDVDIRTALTKAAMVQEEGQSTEDMGKVARVIENRLAIGMPLQFDSTVSYAVGRPGITTTREERATPSPYNTYLNAGLPAGPIASPGSDAVSAVLTPTPGPWLYFVAVNPDTGETRFAATFEEHQENVALFQQWLRGQD